MANTAHLMCHAPLTPPLPKTFPPSSPIPIQQTPRNTHLTISPSTFQTHLYSVETQSLSFSHNHTSDNSHAAKGKTTKPARQTLHSSGQNHPTVTGLKLFPPPVPLSVLLLTRTLTSDILQSNDHSRQNTPMSRQLPPTAHNQH